MKYQLPFWLLAVSLISLYLLWIFTSEDDPEEQYLNDVPGTMYDGDEPDTEERELLLTMARNYCDARDVGYTKTELEAVIISGGFGPGEASEITSAAQEHICE